MGLFDKFFPKRSGAKSGASGKALPSKSKYRGVEINVDQATCCKAVSAIAGRRFLSNEVPALPVDLCDAETCSCTYALFNDRRKEARRAADLVYDVASDLHPNNSRSQDVRGRRDGDV